MSGCNDMYHIDLDWRQQIQIYYYVAYLSFPYKVLV